MVLLFLEVILIMDLCIYNFVIIRSFVSCTDVFYLFCHSLSRQGLSRPQSLLTHIHILFSFIWLIAVSTVLSHFSSTMIPGKRLLLFFFISLKSCYHKLFGILYRSLIISVATTMSAGTGLPSVMICRDTSSPCS